MLKLIQDGYEMVVGLEVHIQLKTRSKLFCSDTNAFGAPPNTNTSVISLAHPGTLPRINETAVAFACRLGIATSAEIAPVSIFDRKNYFYPDLPKGYQITQNLNSICKGGYLDLRYARNAERVFIHKMHIEEDAGKSIHDLDEHFTLLDLNRAGVPLLELVTEPCIHHPEIAAAFFSELRTLVMFLGICDGNMQEGSLRCDANISIRPEGAQWLGIRTEVKNMNSFKNLKRALEFEFKRQLELVKKGEAVKQETRGFNPLTGSTVRMRNKEMAYDYRYFPDPDLPPLCISESYIESVKKNMPVSVSQIRDFYIKNYQIKPEDAVILTESPDFVQYFDKLLEICNPILAANWMIQNIRPYLSNEGRDIASFLITPDRLKQLMDRCNEGRINIRDGKFRLLAAIEAYPHSPIQEIIQKMGLWIEVNDGEELVLLIQQVLEENPKEKARLLARTKNLQGWFIGEVMKKSGGKLDPKKVASVFQEIISNNNL